MNNENLDKWAPVAWEIDEPAEQLRFPFHVLVGEGLDVARFMQRYWEPGVDQSGNVVRPGLSSVEAPGRFEKSIAGEIIELTEALQAAQTNYRLLVDAPDQAPVDRAQFVLGELREVLQWFFLDDEDPTGPAQLDQLANAHDSASSHDAIAAALYDYAGLAEMHRDAIDGLGGFDVSLIPEAREIGKALRERSAGPPVIEPAPGPQQALDLRNRIGTLLYNRMQRVRAAARFALRAHPELVRQVSSAYARRQRAAHRRRSRDSGVDFADVESSPVNGLGEEVSVG